MRANRRGRKGLALIPAMVCLALVATLGAVMLRLAHVQQTTARDEERRMQTDWLAESGIARAGARLATDPDYRGETWEIAKISPDANTSARVTIAVELVEDRPARRRVKVVAEYPRGDDRRNKLTKSIIFDLNPETPGGPS